MTLLLVLLVGLVSAKEATQASDGESLLEVLANGGSPGQEYEIIRRAPDGSLHVLEVGGGNPALPPPGATLVFLEEKPEGGYEVKGVKSSAPVDQLQGLLENIQQGSSGVFLPPTTTEKAEVKKKEEEEEEAEESEIVPETTESLRTSLTEVLRREGYKEMARLMEKTGLQDMLATTGPYTIFAPTDDAFRQLMSRLGGRSAADSKFTENPTLLSGLLLHHVIPGTFKVNSLQDEMTGVSLAGTQLRINVYDGKMVSVNGGRIVRGDIWVPGGGVAHALDSVLFPLPVGDILHTLLSETRFSRFLKIVHAADLDDVLSGKRTYTLFAPIDEAFQSLSVGEMSQLEGDRSKARAFVARHLVPGALYTSGLKENQVKYTMQQGVTIKLQNESGRLKINSSQVSTQNIPATNGVVHAIQTLL